MAVDVNDTEVKEGGRVLLFTPDEGVAGYLKEKLELGASFSVVVSSTMDDSLLVFKREKFAVLILEAAHPWHLNNDFIRKFKQIDEDCVIVGFVNPRNPLPAPLEIRGLGFFAVIDNLSKLDELFFFVREAVGLHRIMSSKQRVIEIIQEKSVSLQKQNTLLANRIEDSARNISRLYHDLQSNYMRTIKALAQAIDARDHWTSSHSTNVAKIAVVISEAIGLSVKELEIIRDACELHDLGKIGISDEILLKPSGLNEEEWRKVKEHPLIGARILEPLTYLKEIVILIKQHHEHYDGSGYPQGLKGSDILFGARIIHVADAYEAMRSPRSYRKIPLTKEDAIAEIDRNSAKQFDPEIVGIFLKIADKLE